MNIKGVIFGALVAVTLLGAGYAFGVKNARNAQEGGIKELRDTLYVRDTITVSMPVYMAKYRVRVDTLRVCDTVAVPVPIERRVYADSNYRAVVSGWHPSLDTIAVYPATRVVTVERERTVVQRTSPRWSLGVQAGYGVTGSGLSPYIGVGAQYNILSF